MTYRLSEKVRADIDGILDYTWSRYGEAQARRYYLDLRDAMDLLADNPLIARERDEYAPPVRIHPHGRHVIVYREEDGGILIVRVLHQSMDIGEAL